MTAHRVAIAAVSTLRFREKLLLLGATALSLYVKPTFLHFHLLYLFIVVLFHFFPFIFIPVFAIFVALVVVFAL